MNMDEAANFVIPAHLTLIEIGKMFLKSCHPNFVGVHNANGNYLH